MLSIRKIVFFLLIFSLAGPAQTPTNTKARPAPPESSPAEDISGMYSFLREGEFLQIIIEGKVTSGYVSYRQEQGSDKGAFVDLWFDQAVIRDHDVSFNTKPVHGQWFEFTGRFNRGPARNKTEDGYYILRGTLTENVRDADKNVTSRSREVEFKLLGQPEEKE